MTREGYQVALSAVTFLLGVAFAHAIDTNVWKGPSTGGNWNDQDNWTLTLAPTIDTIYDFSALGDGAVVTNSYTYTKTTAEQLKIGGLVFGENKGRVKLFGTSSSETIFSTGTIFVPDGTSLDMALRHTTTPWKDQGYTITLAGNGDITFVDNNFKGTIWTYKVTGTNKTVRIGGDAAFELCTFDFGNAANVDNVTIKLTADTLIGAVKGPWYSTVHNWIDIGEYALTVGSGYGISSVTAYEAITGSGPVTFEGGAVFTYRAAPRSIGRYTLRNADVILGRSYNAVADPATSTAGATQLPTGSRLVVDNSGIMTAFCSQSLSALSGEGTCGGIALSTNWAGTVANLAVTGSGTAETNTYNARITGLGGLTKSGSGSTLVLTGDNTYTGATRVAGGTLEVRRPVQELDGTKFRYDFSGDNSWSNAAFGAVKASILRATHIDDGVPGYGRGAVRFDSPGAEALCVTISNPYVSTISSNGPFTVSVWIRPGSGILGDPGKQSYLTFNGSAAWTSREMARMYIYGETNLNFTVGQYEGTTTSPTNGISVNVAYDALHDGRWHQVAMTYGDGNLLSAYFDGALIGTREIDGGLKMSTSATSFKNIIGDDVNSASKHYYGDMDEWKVLGRAMTAEEILADFRRAAPVVETADTIPEPVWRRTFNISSRPTEHLALTGGDFPEGVPTGQAPFTVSCRYRPANNSANASLIAWGDVTTANRFFLVGVDTNSRRRPGINFNLPISTSSRMSYALTNITHSTGLDALASWTHVVCTYDGSNIKVYQDGHQAIATIANAQLDIRNGGLYVGKLPGVSQEFVGYIEDVQIFDVAMTPDQVRSFSRGLKNVGEKEGSVLPETADVQVDAGATFGVSGTSQKLRSLSGTGTLDLGANGEVTLGAQDGFSGSISGRGRLIVADCDHSFAGGAGFCGTIIATNAAVAVAGGLGNAYVELRNGASISGAGAAEVVYSAGAVLDLDTADRATPAIATTGAVTLGDTLSIRMSSRDIRGSYTLVSAGSLSLPQSFGGWRLCDQDGLAIPADSYKLHFVRQGGVLRLDISGIGVTIIFR